MLHQRIATTLRDHFSTVGPSPTTPSPNKSTWSGSIAPAIPNRLILLPSSTSIHTPDVAGIHPASVFHDLLAVSAHRSAAFLAEAAVLVLVLGILDRFLASNRLEPRWIAGAVLLAIGLLAASIATEVSARRWLRAH